MRALFLFLSFFTATLYAHPAVDELKENVCKILPTLQGWCSKEKATNFIDLVLQTRPEVCVEIGVFGGSSVFPVASALKFLGHGMIIGIDPWDKLECIKYFDPIEDKAHLEWWGKVNMDHIYISYLNMIKRHRLVDYCMTIRATSEEAAKEIDTIDILYIDGNHDETSSLRDIHLYLPKVKQGGYIWLDDTLLLDAQAGIDALLDCCDVIKLIDSGNCILFKKR